MVTFLFLAHKTIRSCQRKMDIELRPEIKEAIHKAGEKTDAGFELFRDIWTGICHEGTLSRSQRNVDEFKIITGGLITTVFLFEANPIGMASGAVPFVEAVCDLRHSGHDYRQSHHLN